MHELLYSKSPGLEVAREVAQALHHKVLKGPVIWVYMLKATEPAERPCAAIRQSAAKTQRTPLNDVTPWNPNVSIYIPLVPNGHSYKGRSKNACANQTKYPKTGAHDGMTACLKALICLYIYHVLMQVDETTAAFGSFPNHSTSPRWSVMPPKTRPGQSSSFGFNVSTVSTSEDLYKEYQPIDGKPEYKRPVQELLGIPGHSHDAALTNTFDLTLKTDCSCTDWECSMLRLIFNDDIIDRNSSGFDQTCFWFVGATWCHFLLQLAFLCISWAFHTSLWAFPGTQVVALQLCRRCQELARCNALLNSWNSWALRRRAQWCQGQKWRETFLRINVMWNPLRAFQFQCLWYTDASSFRMVQMQGCTSWSTWYLYTAMYSFDLICTINSSPCDTWRFGVPIPLGATIPRSFSVRCWNTMPGVSSLWCGDVSSNSHIWNASDRMVWWLCKLCHFSVFWLSYWTRGVLMWKNMPSEIQLSRKVFPMS